MNLNLVIVKKLLKRKDKNYKLGLNINVNPVEKN